MNVSAPIIVVALIAADPAPPALPVDCGPEALRVFGTKVQPFLMNACVACHSGDKAGPFALRRATPGRSLHPDTAQANLVAALQQIDRAHPEKSPLLVKTLTAHGGQARPSLKDSNAAAFKNLAEWARLVAAEGKAPGPSPSGSKPGLPDGPARSADPHDPAAFNRGG
jgi:hypothetical protein